MPPFRNASIDASAKIPMKTERTHEENQERAYIAASRRSDRSLEARVESARRASEIHKRRTGRSLRVTEQDVINEEMYEEEDDDLPMQYRRLTAHLQTSNVDFDRRLAAYLTNHVAMRTALGQTITDQYGQPQPQRQFANTPMFSSQSLMAGMSQQQQAAAYRSSPYSLATQQAFQAAMSGRSASVANSFNMSSFPNGLGRRPSGPICSVKSSDKANIAQQPGDSDVKTDTASSTTSRRDSPASITPMQQQPSTFPSPFGNMGDLIAPGALGPYGPLSMSLPLESQQLLGGALDPSDPMTAMLMGGTEYNKQPYQQPFYNYNPQHASGKKAFTSAVDPSWGINQTLAPSMLDTDSNDERNNGTSAAQDAYGNTAFDTSYNDFLGNDITVSGIMSTQATPSIEKDWQNLFDDNLWEEQPSSQPPVAAA